jgi:hypothetical protein
VNGGIHTYTLPLRRLGLVDGVTDAYVTQRRRDDENRNIDVGGDTKSNIDVEVSEILRCILFRHHNERGLSRNIRFVIKYISFRISLYGCCRLYALSSICGAYTKRRRKVLYRALRHPTHHSDLPSVARPPS